MKKTMKLGLILGLSSAAVLAAAGTTTGVLLSQGTNAGIDLLPGASALDTETSLVVQKTELTGLNGEEQQVAKSPIVNGKINMEAIENPYTIITSDLKNLTNPKLIAKLFTNFQSLEANKIAKVELTKTNGQVVYTPQYGQAYKVKLTAKSGSTFISGGTTLSSNTFYSSSRDRSHQITWITPKNGSVLTFDELKHAYSHLHSAGSYNTFKKLFNGFTNFNGLPRVQIRDAHSLRLIRGAHDLEPGKTYQASIMAQDGFYFNDTNDNYLVSTFTTEANSDVTKVSPKSGPITVTTSAIKAMYKDLFSDSSVQTMRAFFNGFTSFEGVARVQILDSKTLRNVYQDQFKANTYYKMRITTAGGLKLADGWRTVGEVGFIAIDGLKAQPSTPAPVSVVDLDKLVRQTSTDGSYDLMQKLVLGFDGFDKIDTIGIVDKTDGVNIASYQNGEFGYYTSLSTGVTRSFKPGHRFEMTLSAKPGQSFDNGQKMLTIHFWSK